MGMSKKAIHHIVQYNKMEKSKVILSAPEENIRSPTQKISYVKYKTDKGEFQMDIQTPTMLLDNFGIPDANQSFFKDDNARAFLKLPLECTNFLEGESEDERTTRQNQLKELRNTCEELDKMLEDNEKKRYRPDYIKVKIPLEYGSNKVLTDLYRRNKVDTEDYKTDGKYTKINVETLDELKSNILYMRKYRYVFHVSKFWAHKQPVNGSDTKKYGLTLKLSRVEILEKPNIEDTQEINNSNPFLDSDDEDNVVIQKKMESLNVFKEEEEEEEDERTTRQNQLKEL